MDPSVGQKKRRFTSEDATKRLEKERKKMTALLEQMQEFDRDDASISSVSDIDDESLMLKKEEIPFVDNHEVVSAARQFLDSEHVANIMKDRVTAKSAWNKLENLCSNPEHRAIMKSQDLQKTKQGAANSFDLLLLTADPFEDTELFANSLTALKTARSKGRGLQYLECFAWLSHAAQCPLEKLTPPGEVFAEVNEYIERNLVHPNLSLVLEEQRKAVALTQLGRCFELLSVSSLHALDATNLSVLLFISCRVLLDKLVESSVLQNKARELVSNIFSSAGNARAFLYEFSQMFPLLCDDMRGFQLILDCIGMSKAHPATCLCLLATVFINKSERAECTPNDAMTLSDHDFCCAYGKVISDTLIDVFDVFVEDRSQQAALVAMLDCALSPALLTILDKDTIRAIQEKVNFIKREWRKKGRTDDAILDVLLNSFTSRMEDMLRDDSFKRFPML